jgi:methionyl-tRNA formyltransferase
MQIAFLTTNDPIYLPALFERVLAAYGKKTHAVYSVAPLYKGQSSLAAAIRYYRTFGLEGVRGLTVRIAHAKIRKNSIASVCRATDVRYRTVKDVNDEAFLSELRAAHVDLVVSVSCPQIFRNDLIELPELGCINVHGSLLPKYRGVLPSFWMLANDEKRAGVSIYFVNEQIDAGELCGQRAFPVYPDDTLDLLLKRSKAIAADLLVEVLEAIESGAVSRTPLDLASGSYYSWPDAAAVERFRTAGRRLW